jgi:glycine cleavage system H lipoate-binding protein
LRGILSIELPYVVKRIRQNETGATVETAKTTVEILATLSGEILSVNRELRGTRCSLAEILMVKAGLHS